MLDVHPPHHPFHAWRDFFVHLATISIGLLIALGLEATVEWAHHCHQVNHSREALQRELEENRQRFAANTANFRRETAALENNLLVLDYLQKHPGAKPSELPGVFLWSSVYSRMEESAWKTASQTGILALMPQDEVMRKAELYGFFQRIDNSHEAEADAVADAIGQMFQDSDPTHLPPAAVGDEIRLTRQVLSKHLRHGFLMQNLAEEYPDFRPGPTREEMEKLLHLPELNIRSDLSAALALSRQRVDAAAPPVPTSAATSY